MYVRIVLKGEEEAGFDNHSAAAPKVTLCFSSEKQSIKFPLLAENDFELDECKKVGFLMIDWSWNLYYLLLSLSLALDLSL